jgi:ParB-like nuclease domain
MAAAHRSFRVIKKLRLGSIRDNRFRDTDLNPIDSEDLSELEDSMRKSGFVGMLEVRACSDGTYELAFGHRRLRAAINVFGEDYELNFRIRKFTDYQMLLLLTDENALQEGDQPAVVLEAVAGWTRYAATQLLCFQNYAAFLDNCPEMAPIFESSPGFERAKGRLFNGSGIGRPLIIKSSSGRLKDREVKESILILRSSGYYQKIISQARSLAEIARANRWQEEEAKIPSLESAFIQEEEKARRTHLDVVAANDRLRKLRNKLTETEKAEQVAKEVKAPNFAEHIEKVKAAKRAVREQETAKRRATELHSKQQKLKAVADKVLKAAKKGFENRDSLVNLEMEKLTQAYRDDRITLYVGIISHLKKMEHVRAFRESLEHYSDQIPIDKQELVVKAVLAEFKKTNNEPTAKAINKSIIENARRYLHGPAREEVKRRHQKDQHVKARDNWNKVASYHVSYCRHLALVIEALQTGADLLSEEDFELRWRELVRYRASVETKFYEVTGFRDVYREILEGASIADSEQKVLEFRPKPKTN